MNQALIVWLVLCLIWGSTWIFIKLGLRDLPPMTFAGLRFLIASVVLWLVVIIRKRPLPKERRDWVTLAWVGVLAFSINYGLIFWGEQYITSGLAAVLQSMIPAFGLVFAHYYLPTERLTLRKIGGALMGIAGVGVIFYDQMRIEGSLALWGSVALLASALDVGYYNVVVKARSQHIDPAVMAAAQMTFGMIPLLVVGSIWEGSPFKMHWTARTVAALLYLSLIGSATAFLLYYWMLQRVDVTKTMLISLITPVIALMIGWLVLSERLTWRVAVGSGIILAGIGLIVFRKQPGQSHKGKVPTVRKGEL